MRKLLESRATEFEKDVDERLKDEHGLVRSAINIKTMEPFPPGYFEGCNVHAYPGHNWTDFSDYMAYEDVGMASGAFLAAMVWKYRTTKDPEALTKAYRTFEGIKWLFDMSQEIDEGFYCKCYGGRISEQISSDQYHYTLAGLNEFLPLADPETRRQGVEMIMKMVRFWMRREYTYQYYGNPLKWPLERFPVFPWLAWHYSGEREFLDEFERLRKNETVRTKLPFGSMEFKNLLRFLQEQEPGFEFERNDNVRVIKINAHTVESGFLSIQALLEHNAPERDLWLDKTWDIYDCGRRFIAPDGYSVGVSLYNLATGKITEAQQVLNIPNHEDPNKWRYFNFLGWIRSAMGSCMFARAAVGIHDYFPTVGALDAARHVLTNIKRENLHWLHDVDGKQYPDDLKWMDDVYSGDAVTHWLWAYWEARAKFGPEWAEYAERQAGGAKTWGLDVETERE